MKKILLSGLAIVFGFAVVAQQAHIKPGIPSVQKKTDKQVSIEPTATNNVAPSVKPVSSGDSPSIVTPIELGSSANAYGYGYGGGQKTMVWADDSLKAVINVHRMGPGSNPPSLSGYIAVDKAINMGAAEVDWTNNWQIYAATLNTGGDYFLDAGRYPQAGIYNPAGNTDVNNAYVAYFAPNLSNTISTWGGYSYGTVKWGDQADSTKHMYWYDSSPHNYIPDGFTIMQNGVALAADADLNWESGSGVYEGNFLVHRGVWNATTNDYDYTMNIMVPAPMATYPQGVRIAASPDNQHVWMAIYGNNGGTTQVGPFASYYPILMHSIDGGLTWSDPIAVQLDGPTGIEAIVDRFISDYRIQQVFVEPFPAREEIPYTTAFDLDLSVDKWGNPHVGVVVGLASTDADYSIMIGDSILGVFDIYSPDEGTTWCAVQMGTTRNFDGAYADLTEYNRVNISTTEDGEKVVVTWIDTDVETALGANLNPDVYARGFDLVGNMITVNGDGLPDKDNVTFLSDLMSQSWFMCASHYLFTDGSDVIVPICTELLSDPSDPAQPVTFYYIPDFKYTAAQFSIPSLGCPLVGIAEKAQNITFSINPNPVQDIAKVSVIMPQASNTDIRIINTVGQSVMSFQRNLSTGNNTFDLNVSNLNSGVYFVNVTVNDRQYTKKMIVE